MGKHQTYRRQTFFRKLLRALLEFTTIFTCIFSLRGAIISTQHLVLLSFFRSTELGGHLLLRLLLKHRRTAR